MILKVTFMLFVLNASCVRSSESRGTRSLQNSNWAPHPYVDKKWNLSSTRRRKSLVEDKDYFRIDENPHASDKERNPASYTELLRVPRDHGSRPPASDQYDRPPPPPPDHRGPPPHGDFHKPPPHYGYDRPSHGHFGHQPPLGSRPPNPPPHPLPPRRPPLDQYYDQLSPPNDYSRPPPSFDPYSRLHPPPPNRMSDWHSSPPHRNDMLPLQDKKYSPEQNSPNEYKQQNKHFPSRTGETDQSSPKKMNYNEEDLIQLIKSLIINQNVPSAGSPGDESFRRNSNQTPLSNRVPKDTENVNEMDSQVNPETVQDTENFSTSDLENGFGLENIRPLKPNVNRKITNDPKSTQSSQTVYKPFLIPLFQATPVTPKSN